MEKRFSVARNSVEIALFAYSTHAIEYAQGQRRRDGTERVVVTEMRSGRHVSVGPRWSAHDRDVCARHLDGDTGAA